ncbi:Uncharacterised protein [Mycobacteroides abscessus subsp. abscessus]|nr:Uncharacterised protein [Mycobacteroides abscessus subsp. abscessus]
MQCVDELHARQNHRCQPLRDREPIGHDIDGYRLVLVERGQANRGLDTIVRKRQHVPHDCLIGRTQRRGVEDRRARRRLVVGLTDHDDVAVGHRQHVARRGSTADHRSPQRFPAARHHRPAVEVELSAVVPRPWIVVVGGTHGVEQSTALTARSTGTLTRRKAPPTGAYQREEK